MSRLMSVSLTEQAVRERRKTVTRRLGWKFLKPGDRLTLVRKAMGLRKGEKVERICEVEAVNVNREPLKHAEYMWRAYPDIRSTQWVGKEEPELEGFPEMTPAEFIDFFCEHMKCTPDTVVTRIEWRYLDEETSK